MSRQLKTSMFSLLVILCLWVPNAFAKPTPDDLPDVAERAVQSVVNISSTKRVVSGRGPMADPYLTRVRATVQRNLGHGAEDIQGSTRATPTTRGLRQRTSGTEVPNTASKMAKGFRPPGHPQRERPRHTFKGYGRIRIVHREPRLEPQGARERTTHDSGIRSQGTDNS